MSKYDTDRTVYFNFGKSIRLRYPLGCRGGCRRGGPNARATGPPAKHGRASSDRGCHCRPANHQTATRRSLSKRLLPEQASASARSTGGGSRRATCRGGVYRDGQRRHPDPDTGDAVKDLRLLLRRLFTSVRPRGHGRPSVNGCRGATRSRLRHRMRRFVESRREVVRTILAEALSRALRADLDPDTAIDSCSGRTGIACSSRTLRWTAGSPQHWSTTWLRGIGNERPQTPIIPGSGRNAGPLWVDEMTPDRSGIVDRRSPP